MRSGGGTRLAIEVVGAIALVAALGWAGSRLLLEPVRPPPPPAVAPLQVQPAPPPEPHTETAMIVGIRGHVDRGGKAGWAPAHTGEALGVDESLRTEGDGEAELQVDNASRLTVTERSQVSVQELTQAVHRFKLVRGRVAVDYQASGTRRLRIESEDSGTAAETLGARFSMLSNGISVAVATETGSVDLKAAGQAVEVKPGYEASAAAGSAPTQPAPIALDVLLKVARAAGRTSPELCAVIRGTASPDSEVLVDDVEVPVQRDGSFTASVPRTREKKLVRVVTRTPQGKTEQRVVACVEASQAIKKVQIDWGDGTKP